MERLILVPLADNPALGAKPLEWSCALWGDKNPWFQAHEWPAFYERAAQGDYRQWDRDGGEQEQIYIAIESGEVVGAIALVDFDDLEDFRHLKPWVAAFIVDPQRRNEGFGSLMLLALEERARTFGITELYLWTEDQRNFYLKRGYHVLEHREYPTMSINILHKVL